MLPNRLKRLLLLLYSVDYILQEKKILGSFPVVGATFGITEAKGPLAVKRENSFHIITQSRTYFLITDSADELEVWRRKVILNGGVWDKSISDFDRSDVLFGVTKYYQRIQEGQAVK